MQPIRLDGVELKWDHEVVHLGVYLDIKVTWRKYVGYGLQIVVREK